MVVRSRPDRVEVIPDTAWKRATSAQVSALEILNKWVDSGMIRLLGFDFEPLGVDETVLKRKKSQRVGPRQPIYL